MGNTPVSVFTINFIAQSTGWTFWAVCTRAWMPSPLQRECSIHCYHGKHCCDHSHKSGGRRDV